MIIKPNDLPIHLPFDIPVDYLYQSKFHLKGNE